jgi:hypothetical protein
MHQLQTEPNKTEQTKEIIIHNKEIGGEYTKFIRGNK